MVYEFWIIIGLITIMVIIVTFIYKFYFPYNMITEATKNKLIAGFGGLMIFLVIGIFLKNSVSEWLGIIYFVVPIIVIGSLAFAFVYKKYIVN